ncbi:DnaB-like helicase N-terminal domain-containing protein [Streptomyces sp. NPDC008163]|uniref:DnaB-like helicase N-terminal domain-containing protein n=1 Tax=Streptomyces sp. NPDC008163 TaxID=3364818 RepID=UPI0036E70A3E
MTHTPEPHHPGDDELAPVVQPPPVFHAEQALLGALLRDPHRLGDVTGIAPDSFSTAAHAAVWAAITTLPAPDPATHAKDTTWHTAVLAATREHARGLTPTYLHTLIQHCSWPSHASAYARMVEADHSRRRLKSAAEHLLHTASDTALPHPVQTVLAETDAVFAVVDDIAIRFPPRAGVRPPPAAVPYPLTLDGEAVEEERLLLATATARPDTIATLRWLLPADFTEPLHAGLWQTLTALGRQQEPVDPVTVLWAAQQHGVLDDGTPPHDVLALLTETSGAADYWAERVLQRSLLTTAALSAQRIAASAAVPSTTPFQLVIGARRALSDLAAVRTRWQHATSPTPPPRPRPATAARAGPPTTAVRPAHFTR